MAPKNATVNTTATIFVILICFPSGKNAQRVFSRLARQEGGKLPQYCTVALARGSMAMCPFLISCRRIAASRFQLAVAAALRVFTTAAMAAGGTSAASTTVSAAPAAVTSAPAAIPSASDALAFHRWATGTRGR